MGEESAMVAADLLRAVAADNATAAHECLQQSGHLLLAPLHKPPPDQAARQQVEGNFVVDGNPLTPQDKALALELAQALGINEVHAAKTVVASRSSDVFECVDYFFTERETLLEALKTIFLRSCDDSTPHDVRRVLLKQARVLLSPPDHTVAVHCNDVPIAHVPLTSHNTTLAAFRGELRRHSAMAGREFEFVDAHGTGVGKEEEVIAPLFAFRHSVASLTVNVRFTDRNAPPPAAANSQVEKAGVVTGHLLDHCEAFAPAPLDPAAALRAQVARASAHEATLAAELLFVIFHHFQIKVVELKRLISVIESVSNAQQRGQGKTDVEVAFVRMGYTLVFALIDCLDTHHTAFVQRESLTPRRNALVCIDAVRAINAHPPMTRSAAPSAPSPATTQRALMQLVWLTWAVFLSKVHEPLGEEQPASDVDQLLVRALSRGMHASLVSPVNVNGEDEDAFAFLEHAVLSGQAMATHHTTLKPMFHHAVDELLSSLVSSPLSKAFVHGQVRHLERESEPTPRPDQGLDHLSPNPRAFANLLSLMACAYAGMPERIAKFWQHSSAHHHFLRETRDHIHTVTSRALPPPSFLPFLRLLCTLGGRMSVQQRQEFLQQHPASLLGVLATHCHRFISVPCPCDPSNLRMCVHHYARSLGGDAGGAGGGAMGGGGMGAMGGGGMGGAGPQGHRGESRRDAAKRQLQNDLPGIIAMLELLTTLFENNASLVDAYHDWVTSDVVKLFACEVPIALKGAILNLLRASLTPSLTPRLLPSLMSLCDASSTPVLPSPSNSASLLQVELQHHEMATECFPLTVAFLKLTEALLARPDALSQPYQVTWVQYVVDKLLCNARLLQARAQSEGWGEGQCRAAEVVWRSLRVVFQALAVGKLRRGLSGEGDAGEGEGMGKMPGSEPMETVSVADVVVTKLLLDRGPLLQALMRVMSSAIRHMQRHPHGPPPPPFPSSLLLSLRILDLTLRLTPPRPLPFSLSLPLPTASAFPSSFPLAAPTPSSTPSRELFLTPLRKLLAQQPDCLVGLATLVSYPYHPLVRLLALQVVAEVEGCELADYDEAMGADVACTDVAAALRDAGDGVERGYREVLDDAVANASMVLGEEEGAGGGAGAGGDAAKPGAALEDGEDADAHGSITRSLREWVLIVLSRVDAAPGVAHLLLFPSLLASPPAAASPSPSASPLFVSLLSLLHTHTLLHTHPSLYVRAWDVLRRALCSPITCAAAVDALVAEEFLEQHVTTTLPWLIATTRAQHQQQPSHEISTACYASMALAHVWRVVGVVWRACVVDQVHVAKFMASELILSPQAALGASLPPLLALASSATSRLVAPFPAPAHALSDDDPSSPSSLLPSGARAHALLSAEQIVDYAAQRSGSAGADAPEAREAAMRDALSFNVAVVQSLASVDAVEGWALAVACVAGEGRRAGVWARKEEAERAKEALLDTVLVSLDELCRSPGVCRSPHMATPLRALLSSSVSIVSALSLCQPSPTPSLPLRATFVRSAIAPVLRAIGHSSQLRTRAFAYAFVVSVLRAAGQREQMAAVDGEAHEGERVRRECEVLVEQMEEREVKRIVDDGVGRGKARGASEAVRRRGEDGGEMAGALAMGALCELLRYDAAPRYRLASAMLRSPLFVASAYTSLLAPSLHNLQHTGARTQAAVHVFTTHMGLLHRLFSLSPRHTHYVLHTEVPHELLELDFLNNPPAVKTPAGGGTASASSPSSFDLVAVGVLRVVHALVSSPASEERVRIGAWAQQWVVKMQGLFTHYLTMPAANSATSASAILLSASILRHCISSVPPPPSSSAPSPPASLRALGPVVSTLVVPLVVGGRGGRVWDSVRERRDELCARYVPFSAVANSTEHAASAARWACMVRGELTATVREAMRHGLLPGLFSPSLNTPLNSNLPSLSVLLNSLALAVDVWKQAGEESAVEVQRSHATPQGRAKGMWGSWAVCAGVALETVISLVWALHGHLQQFQNDQQLHRVMEESKQDPAIVRQCDVVLGVLGPNTHAHMLVHALVAQIKDLLRGV